METSSKRPRTVRGTATIHEDDRIEFKPYAEGESTQKNVRTCKGGKLFTTTSAKAPQQVAHLTCPADTPDAFAEYTAQLMRLGLKPRKSKTPPAEQRLVNEDGLECWLDTAKGELTFRGSIDLSAHCHDWQAEVLRQVQLVVRRLPASERFNKTINFIKKGGNNHV